jgi:rubrerythrin
MRGRAVVPRAKGGERHFRCETCGTIVHGAAAPQRCPTCGKNTFFEADLETSIVDAGPG